MNKKLKKSLSMLLITGLLLTSNSTVFASENNKGDQSISTIKQSKSINKIKLTKDEKEELIDWLTTNGVDENKQSELLNKLEQGIAWDSLTDVTPVETIELTEYSTKCIYADGSISITSIDFNYATPTKEVSKDSESEIVNTLLAERNYKNVIIAYTVGVITCSFDADFTLVTDGRDRIDDVRNPSILCLGLTHSGTKLETNRPVETASYHAQASLSFDVKLANAGSTNYMLSLYVGDDQAYKIFK